MSVVTDIQTDRHIDRYTVCHVNCFPCMCSIVAKLKLLWKCVKTIILCVLQTVVQHNL